MISADDGASTVSFYSGNGDGITDLAVANRSSGVFSILIGNGNGTFKAFASYDPPNVTSDLAIGDFNGDGVDDIFTIDSNGSSPNTFSLFSGVQDTSPTKTTIDAIDLTTITGARAALDSRKTTLDQLGSTRAEIGANMSRLTIMGDATRRRVEEYSEAAQRITSIDVAEEVANMVRLQVLQQAGTALLAQSNIEPEFALRLRRD